MNKSACLSLIVISCTMGLVCSTYSSYGSYSSSYKGINSGSTYYQKVPVPIYRPVPVPIPLTKGIGGYGFGGLSGVFGGNGFGNNGVSSLIAVVIIISLLRNFL
ncbi:hypothetical protein CHS0354_003094 [Potamilus streckersoni]|uniref:Uncharacterized protein n=1 Tax=Potamilus streckersoni TaxID=2493646 RepID=A0AAE0RPA9_9BIVA|nr:hypothetical protein CHS0354_003094 [Potamilus streckersoni]